jgi:hypothetical protein
MSKKGRNMLSLPTSILTHKQNTTMYSNYIRYNVKIITMNLGRYVRRIDSFLNGIEQNEWATISKQMSSYTSMLTPGQTNEFLNCSTSEKFSLACNIVADRICNQALFAFKFKYKRFIKDINARVSSDSFQTESVNMKTTDGEYQSFCAELLANDLKKNDVDFAGQIIKLVYNMETAFQMYYYARMIQSAETNPSAQLKIAKILCEKQLVHTRIDSLFEQGGSERGSFEQLCSDLIGVGVVNEHSSQLNDDILNKVPLFKEKFSALNIAKNTLLISFFKSCIMLPWKNIRDCISADHALCAIFQSVSNSGSLRSKLEDSFSMGDEVLHYQLGSGVVSALFVGPIVIVGIVACIIYMFVAGIFK